MTTSTTRSLSALLKELPEGTDGRVHLVTVEHAENNTKYTTFSFDLAAAVAGKPFEVRRDISEHSGAVTE